MATARLLRASNPLDRVFSFSPVKTVSCISKVPGLNTEKMGSGDGQRKSSVAVKAAVDVATSFPERKDQQAADDTVLKVLGPIVKPRPWRLEIQNLIEKVIIDCRFFTVFAVVGSLLGSVLCFLEGCLLVLESYFQYFHSLSQRSDQGNMVHLLIEAIDMFLVGTAMLVFGMGVYVMFVGSKNIKRSLSRSNLFGLFHLKTPPTWIQMDCVSQAKSKIGHAVMMILQVGIVEKFKSTPLVTCSDLACFAGAVLISSATIFLLSRLSAGPSKI
ncbi:hypothetical protein SLEP1_g38724 [Rubroshorea leprosula]|uniref:Uncharacterized protein n=1 Tax=Rubroshorea leprosula TaxID=152421 RepID=A0AAV5KYZ2_9ROSI|nr:hypothetical protein SLEP1_g38724 [Rubroshorea leprosula]